jgi:hypothetical protein
MKKPGAGSAPKGKSISGGPAGSESVSLVDDRQWRAKSALDDISRAERHKKDPILMGDIASHVEDLRRIVKTASRAPAKTGTPQGTIKKQPKKDRNLG